MKRFIFGERNGIYIIDLQQTLGRIEVAYSFVRDLVGEGGTILFVGTKKQAQDAVQSYAEKCGMPYINERWLGGMLTNFETISKRVSKMQEYRRMRDSGEFEAMPKKEALLISRELEKLERNLGGIRRMERLPDAVFILDTKKEHIAVTEANKLGIPIVAVVDTNCDPDIIQYVIPGNDDAIRSGMLMCRVIADAVDEGRFIASRRHGNGAGPAAAAATRTAEQEAEIAAQQAEARRQAAAAASQVRGPPRRRAGRRRRAGGRRRRRPSRAGRRGRPRRRGRRGRCRGRPARGRGRDRRRGRPSPSADEPPTTTEESGAMPDFTAKDVQALRQATGAGMMDAKKALQENGGDMEAAGQWLREQGLAASAKRDERENSQGAVALFVDGNVGAIVELKSETDFVGQGRRLHLARAGPGRRGRWPRARARPTPARPTLDDLKVTLKENIELGDVERFEAADGNLLDSYLHIQDGRGVNAVLVELAGGNRELAHDVAVHIAFAKPPFLTRDEVPAEATEAERQTLENITRAEGKPEAAMGKIVDGRLTGWFKERVLLEQAYVKDEKQTITQLLGGATIVGFSQVVIG